MYEIFGFKGVIFLANYILLLYNWYEYIMPKKAVRYELYRIG